MGECKKGKHQLNFTLQVLLSKYVDEDKGKDHHAICSFLGIPITGCVRTLKEKRQSKEAATSTNTLIKKKQPKKAPTSVNIIKEKIQPKRAATNTLEEKRQPKRAAIK